MLSALPLIAAEATPREADAARYVDDAIVSARQALRHHPDADVLGGTLDLMREALGLRKRLYFSQHPRPERPAIVAPRSRDRGPPALCLGLAIGRDVLTA